MNILFLCVGNSARSQIAEGLAKSMFPISFDIRSAGSDPTGFVHPNAIQALEKIGIDISKNTSKSIKDLDNKFLDDLDFVITLCAEEICPVLSTNSKFLHWKLEDPANTKFIEIESQMAFKNTVDSLYKLLKKFMLNYIVTT